MRSHAGALICNYSVVCVCERVLIFVFAYFVFCAIRQRVLLFFCSQMCALLCVCVRVFSGGVLIRVFSYVPSQARAVMHL